MVEFYFEGVSMYPITVAIIGAGSRGRGYGNFALRNPDKMKVVAVADPDDFRRNRMVEAHKAS